MALLLAVAGYSASPAAAEPGGPPTVTSVSPNNGQDAGGTEVIVTGTNFKEASAVKFGTANATGFKVTSETSIRASSPAGSGVVDVSVTTPSGTSATGVADQFTYTGKAQWLVNGVAKLGGTAIVSWGTVSLRTVAGGSGEVVCHTVSAGTITNPGGQAEGVGSTQLFEAYRCQSAGCPAGADVVVGEGLPWPSHLVTLSGVIRVRSEGVRLGVECQAEAGGPGITRFIGSYQPQAMQGISALYPGFLEFDPDSGTLEKEGSNGAVQDQLEGAVKLLGYDAQQLIGAK
jgi:hypothetical protein